MPLDERIFYFILGGVIGFILGFMTRKNDEIKQELDEVHEIVKRDRDEHGMYRHPVALNISLVLVLCLSVWASFATSRVNSELQESQQAQEQTQKNLEQTQLRLRHVTLCNTKFQTQTIRALNERTTFTSRQAGANVRLQQAQATFLRVALVIPPPSGETVRAELKRYFQALQNFVELSDKGSDKRRKYKYPTKAQFERCLERAYDKE